MLVDKAGVVGCGRFDKAATTGGTQYVQPYRYKLKPLRVEFFS